MFAATVSPGEGRVYAQTAVERGTEVAPNTPQEFLAAVNVFRAKAGAAPLAYRNGQVARDDATG